MNVSAQRKMSGIHLAGILIDPLIREASWTSVKEMRERVYDHLRLNRTQRALAMKELDRKFPYEHDGTTVGVSTHDVYHMLEAVRKYDYWEWNGQLSAEGSAYRRKPSVVDQSQPLETLVEAPPAADYLQIAVTIRVGQAWSGGNFCLDRDNPEGGQNIGQNRVEAVFVDDQINLEITFATGKNKGPFPMSVDRDDPMAEIRVGQAHVQVRLIDDPVSSEETVQTDGGDDPVHLYLRGAQ